MDNQNIYAKMANILKETKAITKSEKNQQQGFKFRGIDNVMNELHELFAKNDVFILQEVQDFTVDARPTAKGGTLFYTRAKIKFRYTTTDGSFVETVNVGEAMDSGDKGDYMALAMQEIGSAQSVETLAAIFNNYQPLHGNPQFMQAMTNRKNTLKNGTR